MSNHENPDTEAELQSHLAELEAKALTDDIDPVTDNETNAAARLNELHEELVAMRHQLAAIKTRSASVVKTGGEWIDASAHAQLGAYPWIKLAAAGATAFLIARVLRPVPLGAIATASLPLLISRDER